MSIIKEELKGKQKRNMSYTILLYPKYSTKIINKYKGIQSNNEPYRFVQRRFLGIYFNTKSHVK